MSVTPRPLSPNMSQDQMVAVLNENFANVQQSSRTQILTDTSGVQRIIIGILPDGSSGIVITKPGVSVTSLFT